MQQMDADIFRFGDVVVDTAERLVRKAGHPVDIGDRAFDLLHELLRARGRMVTKDILMDKVWPNTFVTDNNLQVQVSALRKLIGRDAIQTVAGRGYRFMLAVETVADDPQHAAPAATAQPPEAIAPHERPELLGRSRDVASLQDLLHRERLVTITGPGGIGKSTLARHIADLAQAQGRPVAWVELSTLTDPALVPAQLARSFGIDLAVVEQGPGAILDATGQAAWLIILDNAEHLLERLARLVTDLSSPGIVCLVTSQVRLKLPDEHVYRLDGLSSPEHTSDPEQMLSFGAPGLFVKRARAIDGKFAISEANAANVLAICRKLDGNPLALELAASRLPLFGIDGLARKLDQRLQVLSGGFRNALPRHQALKDLFEWSYGLMPEIERVLFRRLGAFVGQFPLEWACSLGEDFGEWNVIDALANLLDRSLLVSVDGDTVNYRLSETARAFAMEKLLSQNEHATISRTIGLYEQAAREFHARAEDFDAIHNYGIALELLRHLPESRETAVQRVDLLLKLGPSIQTALSPANPRCAEVYQEAIDIARRLDDQTRLFHALWGYWQYLSMMGNLTGAAPIAAELAGMTKTLNDPALELEAWHANASTNLLMGHTAATLAACTQVRELYDPVTHIHLADNFGGHDAGICAEGQSAVARWLAGDLRAARDTADRVVTRANRLDHPYSRAVGHYYGAIAYYGLHVQERFEHSARELQTLADGHGMAILQTEGNLFHGRAVFDAGDRTTGLAAMRDAYAAIIDSRDIGFAILYATLVADALLACDRDSEAGAMITQALGFSLDGQELMISELYRLQGQIARRAGQRALAMDLFDQAANVASRQEATILELRARLDAARLDGARRAPLSRVLARIDRHHPVPEILAAQGLLEP
jgi:predicted ATPase